MPSLMLPSFPDLPYCSWCWAGHGEVRGVLEAHLAPTSSWHIPPAQGTQPRVRTSPQAHREAGDLQTSWHVPSSSAGSLCACFQGEQGQHCPAAAKAARQGPLPRPEAANSHRLMPSPHGASLFSGPLAGMLGAERAMDSLWSPFPAFYPSWWWLIMRRLIPALYQGPKITYFQIYVRTSNR